LLPLVVNLELLAAECKLLPTIAEALPLPVPVPTLRGEPRGDYPWPFAGYPMLPGRTACMANLDDDTRAAAAKPLADFLSALHSLGHRARWKSANRAGRSRRHFSGTSTEVYVQPMMSMVEPLSLRRQQHSPGCHLAGAHHCPL
jgi:aminoglycoside phosphotransferase (APT) family kinase protein